VRRFHGTAWRLLLVVATAGAGGAVAAPAGDGLQILERVEYYDLDATDADGLVAQLAAHRPKGPSRIADALAEIRLEARHEPGRVPAGCRPQRLRVEVEIVVSLPRWTRRPPVVNPLVERWTRMIAGLRRHEEGHRDHARHSAERLYEQLLALPPQPTCAAMKRLVDATVQRAAIRLQLQGDIYDQQTRHGHNQGAIF